MSEILARINENIDKIALEVVTLEYGDVQRMGKMIKYFKELEEDSRKLDDQAFTALTQSLKSYIENLPPWPE